MCFHKSFNLWTDLYHGSVKLACLNWNLNTQPIQRPGLMLPFIQSINIGLAFVLILSLQIFQDPWKLSDHDSEVLTQILIYQWS